MVIHEVMALGQAAALGIRRGYRIVAVEGDEVHDEAGWTTSIGLARSLAERARRAPKVCVGLVVPSAGPDEPNDGLARSHSQASETSVLE